MSQLGTREVEGGEKEKNTFLWWYDSSLSPTGPLARYDGNDIDISILLFGKIKINDIHTVTL